jgi:hypothetical protein
LPADLITDSFSPIIAAILANPQSKAAFYTDDIPSYCATCKLFCPLRKQADQKDLPWRILPRCPHCGDDEWV